MGGFSEFHYDLHTNYIFKLMDGPPVDEYIDRLNLIPPLANQKLRLIRKLDQKVLALQLQIDAKRAETLVKVA